MSWGVSALLRVVALILFVIAALVVIVNGSFQDEAALVPGGLAFWCLSTLVP